MVCGVTRAVAEFMVRVLHSRVDVVGTPDCQWLESSYCLKP
jgi:hypothetical protein